MAVTSQIKIDASPEKVWGVLADIGNISQWNPGVKASNTTSEQSQGDGTLRHCDLDGNDYVEERMFDWREGEGYKVDIFETSMPLKSNIVTFQVTPDGDGTSVTVNADYVLKFGLIGQLMDVLFAKRQAQQGFDDMMTGLKYHVETGNLVDDEVPAMATA